MHDILKAFWKRMAILAAWVFGQTFVVSGFAWRWCLGIAFPWWKMLVVSAIFAATMVFQNWLFNRPRLIGVAPRKAVKG